MKGPIVSRGAINSRFDVDDLFRLQKMSFAVEISLAKARKEDSKIRVRNNPSLDQIPSVPLQ